MSVPLAGDGEFFDAYTRGQVSRRTFIRRLVTTGVSLAVASTYADVLHAAPAAASDCSDYYEANHPGPIIYVHGSGFHPNPVTVAQGGAVQWRFGYRLVGHQIRDDTGMGLYDSGPRYYCDRHEFTFFAAGVYQFLCADDPGNHWPVGHPVGTVAVPLRTNPASGFTTGTPFRVIWASVRAPRGFVYDVLVRHPGETAWSWLLQGATVSRMDFTPSVPGQYRFRARMRRPGHGQSLYQPIVVNVA